MTLVKKIWHITHIENIPPILATGALLSDARCRSERSRSRVVGMSDIKRRRLEELSVTCHPDTRVGAYVPFYFCRRSVMLYILHRGNHPGLDYDGGQSPIVHLQADLEATIDWAESNGVRWAFTARNAGSRTARHSNRRQELDQLDWDAIAAQDWKDPAIKEAKQAEFLIHDRFPMHLVEGIATYNRHTLDRLRAALADSSYTPKTAVKPSWYY